jgi:hypothetical protein
MDGSRSLQHAVSTADCAALQYVMTTSAVQCALLATAAKQQRARQFIKITQRCHLSLASMAACLASRACCRKQLLDATSKKKKKDKS